MGDWDSSESGGKLGESGVLELTGKIMVVTVMVLFLVVVFVFCLHLYAKWFLNRGQENSPATTTRRRRRRLDFAPGMMEMNATADLRQGLESSALIAIPIVLFSAQESSSKEMECAVCLSEVSEGEKVRFLPKCNHGFHVECIDMWFESHSTCPLCRNPVSDQVAGTGTGSSPDSPVQEGPTAEALNFPTNVLFWGDETRVSTLTACLDMENAHHHPGVVNGHNFTVPSSSTPSTSDGSSNGALVIDIPRQNNDDEAQKSPLPTPTRLRSSFKRLLSRDRRISPRSANSSDVDLEQQGS